MAIAFKSTRSIMKGLSIFALSYLVVSATAVKHELYKECKDSGFCLRNRYYAGKISELNTDAPYNIDPQSVAVLDRGIEGVILKDLPQGRQIPFQFELLLLKGDSIRFRVDEDRKNVKAGHGKVNVNRFDGTANAVFDDDPESKRLTLDLKVSKTKSGLLFNYGEKNSIRLELNYSPLKLTVSKDGEQVLVVNDKQFMNIEHYRAKEENADNINAELESDFDMFKDSFKDSKDDSLPLGPEAVALDATFVDFQHVYGIPEHADSFSLKSTVNTDAPYRLYNLDIFEYETDSRMAMYGQIPLLMGIKKDVSVAIFWMNSADTFVDIDKQASVNAHWMSENGLLDFIILTGDTPTEINTKFGLLTGNVQLPQKFALGYHQCRWNYLTEEDLLDVHSKMDENRIPYDTIWLDVEYTDKKKYFTWDESLFPHHIKMMEKLDETGRNLVVIVDPHLKTEYDVSDYVSKHNLAVNNVDAEPYKGHCWPGESIWIDSLNSKAQEYWTSLFQNSTKAFIGKQNNVYLWNDMNEPAIFNGPETSAPRDNLHYDNWEHRSVHNIYGKSFHELTYNALVERLRESTRQRPFVLTRAFFAGSQRTAAMWTGDNMAKWEYLKISIPMVLSLNAVNMPFSGADVGGFFGDPTTELLTRWYQTGIWYPFFRAHAHIDSRRREPYLFDEPYLSVMRDAIRLRYALLPTFYTLFRKSSLTGAPIWKPMAFEYPGDEKCLEVDDQFYLGDSGLLVKPVTEQGASSVDVFIPNDGQVYYDYTNGRFNEKALKVKSSGTFTKSVELKDIPVFVKGGSIFARQDRYRRSSKLMENDPYTIVVALDKNGAAEGSLYLDDGESFGYTEGEYADISFKATGGNRLVSTIKSGNGNYGKDHGDILIERIIIAGVENKVNSVIILADGKKWETQFVQNGSLFEIKLPNVDVASDWSIQLSSSVEHDEF